MKNQALARKWRPKNFDSIVGQEFTIQTIKNSIQNERIHHAYLFSGTRGVGKTTIARIFAKCLNCQSGVTDTHRAANVPHALKLINQKPST